MNNKFQNASEHRHGTTEHLTVTRRRGFYLIQSQRVVLQGGVGQDDVNNENDTDEDQILHLRLLQRSVVEESGGSVLHHK